jgi:hypothetical protein
MREYHSLRVVVDYDPLSGLVRVQDQWVAADGMMGHLALITTLNVHRNGRESVYREMRDAVSQYLDILDGRAHEDN